MAEHHIVTQVANDGDLQARVAACAAVNGVHNPVEWATANRWKVAAFNATPNDPNASIAAVYAYAEATKTINVNQRTGQRTDAVNDTMIEAAVDAILAAESN